MSDVEDQVERSISAVCRSGRRSVRSGSWTRTEDRLVADVWMQEKPCRVTIDAGAFVTVARPDIVVGMPERRPGRQCVLQVGSRRTIPVVKEAQVCSERTIPRRERGAERADSEAARSEYLGVRRRYNGRPHPGAGYPAALPRDSGRGTPCATTGQDEVPVREAPTASALTQSRPAESYRKRRPVYWQCSGTGNLMRERAL
jgi:hypothetical protein